MTKVAIVTDSVACLPKELVEKYGIEMIPVQVIFGQKAYRDGIDITQNQFYSLLKQSETLPTTAAPPPGLVLEAFKRANQKASTLLCITLSTKFSGMFNVALQAIEMAKETLPGLTVALLDSRTATTAEGFVVLAAARAAAVGKILAEVTETAESVMQKVNLFVTLVTLHYLAKGGRVP